MEHAKKTKKQWLSEALNIAKAEAIVALTAATFIGSQFATKTTKDLTLLNFGAAFLTVAAGLHFLLHKKSKEYDALFGQE